MNRLLATLAVIILAVGAAFLVFTALDNDDNSAAEDANTAVNDRIETENEPQNENQAEFEFANPKKSAHYVSNSPEHGAVLASAPREVAINFNFDLADNSTISIKRDGKEVSSGPVKFTGDALRMSRTLAAGSGLYTVEYNACWPDGSCHDGSFQFGVE